MSEEAGASEKEEGGNEVDGMVAFAAVMEGLNPSNATAREQIEAKLQDPEYLQVIKEMWELANCYSVIPGEQTPKVLAMKVGTAKAYIGKNAAFLQQFLEYCTTRTDACGLAANQLQRNDTEDRVMERVMALKPGPNEAWRLAIDPKILRGLGKATRKFEGCLTWPGRKIVVSRYPKVIAAWHNQDGSSETKTLEGFEAQVFQHEVDHLNGVEEIVVDVN